jgi:O-antigen/teichoic acid export membrane protein
MCFFLLHHGDRFFLKRFVSESEIGTYALGYKLALAVSTFTLAPLYMVWSSRMYAVARTPLAAVTFGRVFTRVMAGYLYVGVGLCLFGREVVIFLGGPEYSAAALIIPPVVLGCFFQASSSLMDAGLYVRRRTGVKLGVAFLTTIVMLGLYFTLIPAQGAMGAALATLGGFTFLAVATYFASQQVFPVRYELTRFFALLALVLGTWPVGQLMPANTWGFLGKVGLMVLIPVYAWLVGLITWSEKSHVRQGAARVFARLRPARPAAPQQRSPGKQAAHDAPSNNNNNSDEPESAAVVSTST